MIREQIQWMVGFVALIAAVCTSITVAQEGFVEDPTHDGYLLDDERRWVKSYLRGIEEATSARTEEIKQLLERDNLWEWKRKSLESELSELENGQKSIFPYYYPEECVDDRVGHMIFSRSEYRSKSIAEITQIVDGKNCLVMPDVDYRSRHDDFIWFEMDTTGHVDCDELVVSEMCFTYLGTRKYETVMGGSKTVRMYRVIDILPLLEQYKADQDEVIADQRASMGMRRDRLKAQLDKLNARYEVLMDSDEGRWIDAERKAKLYEPVKEKDSGREQYATAKAVLDELSGLDEIEIDRVRNELQDIQQEIKSIRREMVKIEKALP